MYKVKTAAIILAGGRSERLATDRPKQFLEVGGKPLISYALEQFEKHFGIGKIVIVVNEEWRGHFKLYDKFFGFAEPGITRQESILNALKVINESGLGCDRVIIHDAARPLITQQDITDCLSNMNGYDGATPYLEVTDTVYQSEDGQTISGLLNRDSLYAGQTPECYGFHKYLKAHGNVDLSKVRGSSEIAFQAGMRIHIYPGNKKNFKITTKPDLDYFTYLLDKEG